MRKATYQLAVVSAGLGVLLSLGCGDSTRAVGPAPTGQIVITAVTKGVSSGTETYGIRVDYSYFYTMGPNATMTLARQPVGKHFVELSQIPGNCVVTGDKAQPVDVIADQASVPVNFSVSCSDPGDGCPGCWDY